MKKVLVALMLSAVVLMAGCNDKPTVLDQKCVEIHKARGSAESQIKSICTVPAE